MYRKAMDHLRTLLSRCAADIGRKKLDADLEEELRGHIDLAIEENMASGMNYAEARTAALRSFGGLTQIQETYRVRRGLPLLDQLGRDLHYGVRQLYRAPGFALTAILTLALGLGANTAVFSLINGLLLRPLPVPHADALAVVGYLQTDRPHREYYFSLPMFRALEKRQDAFQDTAAFSGLEVQVRGASGNVQVPGVLVSGRYFQVLETPPLLGRYLTEADDRMGNPAGLPVVISEGFWGRRFNRAQDVLGRKLVVANVPFTVVGVMPETFIGADPLRRPDVFAPLSTEPIVQAPFDAIAGGEHVIWLQMIARRRPEASLDQANAALGAASDAVLAASVFEPGFLEYSRKNHFRLSAEPGSTGYSRFRDAFQKPLMVVFSLCGTMLLLACLNLTSLLMARAAARERELATRLAIGASRARLIQQLLLESMLIAVLGTATGLALAPLVSRALAAVMLGNDRMTVLDTSLDTSVLLFAVATTMVATLLIGLLPALRATSGNLNSIGNQIRNGSQTRSPKQRQRLLPRLLMGTEVALALMLVVGAGLLATSLMRLYRTGLGFDPKGVVNLQLDMDQQPLKGEALTRWYQAFGEGLGHLPGVTSVSFESYRPLSGWVRLSTGRSAFHRGDVQIYINVVAPNYFDTMRIPLYEGRDFRWNESRSTGLKMVLSQSAARALFPAGNAVGQQVTTVDEGTFEVVGVVGDVHYVSIRASAEPEAYFSMTQGLQDWKLSYPASLRVTGSAAPLAAAVRELAARMAPEIPAPVMTTMSSGLDASISAERMMAMLSIFFAVCALLVTAIGLYGTLAYTTARRTSEIGIRMALGARRTQVVGLVFRENAWIAVAGTATGLIAAMLASRVLASFLYGTSVRDPWVLIGSVLALSTIASAASLLPALRAARIEPMEALRSE